MGIISFLEIANFEKVCIIKTNKNKYFPSLMDFDYFYN